MPYITIFSSSSVTDYFAQSNLAGQIIVIFLLAFSVLAWGLMFCKNSDLSAMDSSNKETMRKISKSSSLIEAAAAKSLHGPYAVLLRDAGSEWAQTSPKATRQPAQIMSKIRSNAPYPNK